MLTRIRLISSPQGKIQHITNDQLNENIFDRIDKYTNYILKRILQQRKIPNQYWRTNRFLQAEFEREMFELDTFNSGSKMLDYKYLCK